MNAAVFASGPALGALSGSRFGGRPRERCRGAVVVATRQSGPDTSIGKESISLVPNARSLRQISRTGSLDVRCHSLGISTKQPASVYARPVGRSTQRLPAWFEPCVRSVVSNLGRAPILAAVYDHRGLLSTGTQFVAHSVTEEMAADPSCWRDFVRTEDSREARTLIYVRKVSGKDACSLTDGKRQAASCTSDTPEPITGGSVGDCPSEVKDPCDSEGPSSTSYWGVVMQSPGEGPNGCYLLKTTQNIGGDCTCTHYSMTKVCGGMTLEQQFVDSWTASPYVSF